MTLRAIALAAVLTFGGLAGFIVGDGGTAVAAGSAGTYTITACSPSSSAGGWTSVDQLSASLTSGNLCGNGTPAIGPNNAITDTGALYGEDVIGSTTQVPNGDQAGWELIAPNGVTITGVSYYSSYETDGEGWLAGLVIDGQPPAQNDDDCWTNSMNNPHPCQVLNDQVPQVQSDLGASSLFFGVECDTVGGAPTCSPGSSLHEVEADLYSAQVTLVESAEPQVQVQVQAGGLWGSGPVWGTVPLSFDASDPSGIARVDVLDSGGSDVDDVQQSCVFSQVEACPELPSGQVAVNTLDIPDGPQQISLKLTDAAGNTTVVHGPTVVVDNNGPPSPSSLTATAASSKSDVIDLAWADPANPPEPVQNAYAQLCQGSCETAMQVSASGGAQITAPRAGTYTVRVWLTDTAGRGSSANAATTSVTVPATTPLCCAPTKPASSAACKGSKCPVFKVTSATWSKDRLRLTIAKLPKGDRLQITIYYAHKPKRTVTTTKSKLTVTTVRPTRLVLRALKGKRPQGATVTVTKFTGQG